MALEQEPGGGGDNDPALAAARLGLWLSESLREERLSLALELEGRHRALAEELRAQLLHGRIPETLGCDRALALESEAAPLTFGSADTAPTPLSAPSSPSPAQESNDREPSVSPGMRRRQQSFIETVEESCVGGSLGAILDKQIPSGNVSNQDIPVQAPSPFLVVDSPLFDRTFSLLIIMSTIVHAFEVQYQGVFNGLLIGAPNYNASDEHFCQGCKSVFAVFDWIFGLAFFGEMLVKMVCMGWRYGRSRWNFVDMVINGMWLIHHLGSRIRVNPTVFRLLRVIRLVRLVRLGKLVSVMQMFDSLHLLMSSIRAGWSVLLWSTVLLVGVMVIAALSLNKMLVEFISDEDEDINARLRVFRYFGDFTKAMLTMFEITLGNWVPVCRTISEDVNMWYGLVFISYELVVGFAMVKVITGVFMHETFNAVSTDDDLLILMRERQVAQYVRRMEYFFNLTDVDHNGKFSWEEFMLMIRDERSKVWLSGMGLDVHDAQLTFELLDDGDGSLTTEELVRGFSRLRGEARSIDVLALLQTTRRVEMLVGQVGDHVRQLQLSSLRSAAQRNGQRPPFIPSSSPVSLSSQPPARAPTRHRGELFVGSCTEGVSDERLPCVLSVDKSARP